MLLNHFEYCRNYRSAKEDESCCTNQLEISEPGPSDEEKLKAGNALIKAGLEKLRETQFNSASMAQRDHLILLQRQQQQEQLQQTLSQQ